MKMPTSWERYLRQLNFIHLKKSKHICLQSHFNSIQKTETRIEAKQSDLPFFYELYPQRIPRPYYFCLQTHPR